MHLFLSVLKYLSIGALSYGYPALLISNTHILIDSARTEKNDKLKGLNLGADDYIEKPYDIDILLAKIKGIFKRRYAREEMAEGGIRLNTVKQTLYVNDVEVTAIRSCRH